jgi:hypothetical protein
MKLLLSIALAMSCFGCVSRQIPAVDDGAIVDAFFGSKRSTVTAPNPVPRMAAQPRKTLIQLEAEELRIRNQPKLTRAERMQKLRVIWDQQLALLGKK